MKSHLMSRLCFSVAKFTWISRRRVHHMNPTNRWIGIKKTTWDELKIQMNSDTPHVKKIFKVGHLHSRKSYHWCGQKQVSCLWAFCRTAEQQGIVLWNAFPTWQTTKVTYILGERSTLMLHSVNTCLFQEPTSGLDAALAFKVMTTLQSFTVEKKRTLVTTIHQPSSKIFHMFQTVMLLTGGQVSCTIYRMLLG